MAKLLEVQNLTTQFFASHLLAKLCHRSWQRNIGRERVLESYLHYVQEEQPGDAQVGLMYTYLAGRAEGPALSPLASPAYRPKQTPQPPRGGAR